MGIFSLLYDLENFYNRRRVKLDEIKLKFVKNKIKF